MDTRDRKLKVAIGLLIAMFLFAMFFPFLWVFITSFKTSGEIFGEGAFRIIPEHPTLGNFVKVIMEKGILNAVKTSFIVSSTTTIYIVIVATFAAYAISRFDFKGKKFYLD